MSDGKVHAAATIGLSLGVLTGYSLGYLTDDPVLIGVTVLGVGTGVFIGPDQDVDNGNISNYYVRKLFIIDWFWSAFWNPYRLAFKHRGFWSHSPIISTLLRLFYLVFPPIVVLIKDQPTSRLKLLSLSLVAQMLALPLIWLLYWFSEYWSYILLFGLGLMLSDLLHLVFDL
jgi:uncharacterized metal-binding protein